MAGLCLFAVLALIFPTVKSRIVNPENADLTGNGILYSV